MKRFFVFSIVTLVLVAGLYQLVSAKASLNNNPTQKPITAVSQTPAKALDIQSSQCPLKTCDISQCPLKASDMSQCPLKVCEKQNSNCSPEQYRKCFP
jgi:hypothetical protein